MATTLEERVAYLEGQTAEHVSAIGELRLDVRDLRAEMSRRFDQMEAKFDMKFTWMIGFQFATLMAVIAALLNVRFR